MEEAYSNLNNAYLQIKGMIVVEGFYALVAGFVLLVKGADFFVDGAVGIAARFGIPHSMQNSFMSWAGSTSSA